MGVIPMKEEDGVQEIYTRDHGTVKVKEKTWQDGRFHIVPCPNGAYQHMNGLPVKNEEELVEAFGGYEGSNTEDLEKALNWFRNRHDQAGKAPRAINMHPDGHPVFDDGTIPDFDDLYAYFRPGKGLTGMIVALQDYKDRQGTGQAPKELRQAVVSPVQVVPDPDMVGDTYTPPPAPSPTELARVEAMKAKERIRQSKIRAAKAKEKAKAAKSAQPAVPSPAQSG